MSIGILVGKIAALFIVMFLGFVLVKTGICRSDDSRILSRLSVYIVVPCSILSAFQVSCSPSILNGLLLAVAAAVLIHLILIVLFYFIGPLLHLNGVEKASIIYSNAGNLVIPLVSSILGPDWVIYSSAYVSVQLFLLWSHGKMMICEEKKPDFKKNHNKYKYDCHFIRYFSILGTDFTSRSSGQRCPLPGKHDWSFGHADLRNADCRNHAPGNSDFSPYWTCHDSAAHRCTAFDNFTS